MFLLSDLFQSGQSRSQQKSQQKSQKKSGQMGSSPSFRLSASKLAAAVAFGTGSLAIPLALGTVALGTAGAGSALAVVEPDYFACAEDMTAAGVADADAIALCASARYPQDLGACVIDVSEFTGANGSKCSLCLRAIAPPHRSGQLHHRHPRSLLR